MHFMISTKIPTGFAELYTENSHLMAVCMNTYLHKALQCKTAFSFSILTSIFLLKIQIILDDFSHFP